MGLIYILGVLCVCAEDYLTDFVQGGVISSLDQQVQGETPKLIFEEWEPKVTPQVHEDEVFEQLESAEGNDKFNIELKAAIALVAGFVLIPLIFKAAHRQKLGLIKKRFVDDLQEEVETSLETIGLLSNLASEPHNTPADQANYMRRIRRLSHHTSGAVQHLLELRGSKLKFKSFRDEVERTTDRILSQTNFDLEFFGDSYLNKLSALSQMGLFLFYKEYLSNAVKHTTPASIRIQFRSNVKETTLKVEEEGMLGIASEELSPTLQHRVRLMNAKISMESGQGNSFALVLVLPNNKWGVF